jgi:hypothetical protein
MNGANRLRGVTAAVILSVSIIGLPIALAGAIGNPVPQLPSLSASQLSDSAVIAILATVFWLAWLSFVVPAALEIVLAVFARITRRPQPRVRLPFLGVQQDLARNLISAVLLLIPVASSAVSASAAPVSHHTTIQMIDASMGVQTHRAPTPDSHADRDRRTVSTRTYVIPETGGLRSYWALAEHFLDDGTRWREIWHLNEGRAHADGAVMDSPRQLHAGWTILIPDAADHAGHRVGEVANDVTVEPGDTLSGIASAHEIDNWNQVWKINADRPEPEGARLTNPDLIRPGWTITLPSTSNGHTTPAERPNRTHPSNPKEPTHPQPPQPSKPVPQNEPRSDGPPATLPSPVGVSPTATPSNEPATSTAPAPQHNSAGDHSDHADHHLPVVPLGIGLGAVAAVAALDRARRIAQRRRRVGHRPLPPPPALRDIEARIRRDARRAQPTIAAVTLATALTGTYPVRIHIVVARSDGAVDLYLDGTIPQPPPPFVEIVGGWRLPVDDSLFAFAAADENGLDDPCPMLIPVGSTADGQVLVNLTSTGPVSVTGEQSDVEAFLKQTLIALHAAPWADRVQLHVPAHLAERLPLLERLQVEDTSSPRPPAGQFSEGSDDGPEEPGWRTAPVHLFCGWSADADLTDILLAATDASSAVHVVVTGAHTDTTAWILDGDSLTIPGLAQPITIPAHEVVDHDAANLLQHTAIAPDVRIGDPRLPDVSAVVAPERESDREHDGPPLDLVEPRLRFLGPVELDGAGRLPRSQVLNLLTLLALHPRGVDRYQLLAALWPEQTVSLQTMRNRIRETRRLVDGGITDGPIWRLTDTVTTDWDQFITLATGDIDDQRRALDLVRGRPFIGLDDADWIDLGGFRSEVEAAIVDVALTVAEHDLAAENYPGALAAARAGLLASRYEERLHRIGIEAAEAQGGHGVAKTMQQEMRNVLDLEIEPDDQIQPETLSLIRDLRDRRPIGSDTTQR